LRSDATFQNFQKEIGNERRAVAFIGHSFVPGTTAIGLCFWQACVVPIGKPLFNVGTVGQQVQDDEGNLYTITLGPAQLDTGARLVFISACDVDTSLQNFIGINAQTQHCALVVADGVFKVGLFMGELAWLHVRST